MITVNCINKDDRYNPYERITHIGWVDWNWNRFRITQEKTIDYILNKKYNFYVKLNWIFVKLIVEKSRYWNNYIKTENDWNEPNNLLSLQECSL